MLGWGMRRQMTIVLIILLACIVGALSFYFIALKPAPSCTDMIRNQEELGVDCGGPCARVCAFEVSDIITFWTRFFRVGNGVYDIAAFMENPNVGFGVDKLAYTFKLYDAKNLLISEKSGVTYVNDKERFVIFEPRIDVGNRVPARALLEIQDFEWIRTTGMKARPRFTLENKQLSLDPAPRLSVDLYNPQLAEVKGIEVAAIVYDEANNALGVSTTHIDSIAKMSMAPVVFTWPGLFSAVPAVTEIYPRINGVSN